jgi:hypothetical protein
MRVAFLVFWLFGFQDKSDICSQFNRCHSQHDKERVKCPKCDRNSIPKEDALCRGCAAKDQVCMHCGLPKVASARKRALSIEEAAALIKPEDMRKLLSHIASDEMKGRLAGSPEHMKLTEEFAEIYRKAGFKPAAGGSFFQDLSVGGRPSRNVCAFLEGERKDEIILYGGHSDHVGVAGNGPPMQQKGGAVGGDTIFNGADDNGSGTATVLTIARVMGEAGLKPKRSILFMNWTGEEWGLVGSKHNAKNLLAPKPSILAVVNTDMLGRYGSKGSVQVYGLGTEAGNDFEAIVQKCCDKAGVKANLQQPSRVGGGDSDHSSYRDIGIPGMFWFTGTHADYHRVTDHADKIDYDGLSKIARAVLFTLWEMANSDSRWGFQQK